MIKKMISLIQKLIGFCFQATFLTLIKYFLFLVLPLLHLPAHVCFLLSIPPFLFYDQT